MTGRRKAHPAAAVRLPHGPPRMGFGTMGFKDLWRREESMKLQKKVPCLVNGVEMLLDPSEGIQRQMMKGQYEPTQTQWVRNHLKPGGVFVDVGASFGHYTTLAHSLVGPGGQVFAFDPSPVAFASLKSAIDAAGIPNVMVINAAAGNQQGELVIYMPPASATLHSPSAFESHPGFTPVSVPMLRLDEFGPLTRCASIDMLKMDVEGFEPDVLEGMRGLIADAKVKRIICEFNSWWLKANHTTVDALFAKFDSLGFKVEQKTDWQRNLPATKGETFDLQDVLFRHASVFP